MTTDPQAREAFMRRLDECQAEIVLVEKAVTTFSDLLRDARAQRAGLLKRRERIVIEHYDNPTPLFDAPPGGAGVVAQVTAPPHQPPGLVAGTSPGAILGILRNTLRPIEEPSDEATEAEGSALPGQPGGGEADADPRCERGADEPVRGEDPGRVLGESAGTLAEEAPIVAEGDQVVIETDLEKVLAAESEEDASPEASDEMLLIRALHSFQGADERWESFRRLGATDKQLHDQIGHEFGTEGGHSGKDGKYRIMGGRNPRIWINPPHPRGKPTLSGNKLVAKARQVLDIPALKEIGGQRPIAGFYARTHEEMKAKADAFTGIDTTGKEASPAPDWRSGKLWELDMPASDRNGYESHGLDTVGKLSDWVAKWGPSGEHDVAREAIEEYRATLDRNHEIAEARRKEEARPKRKPRVARKEADVVA